MKDQNKLEQELSQTLTEGEMRGADPTGAAVDRLNPRYEIRTRAEKDPIVEETKIVRTHAKEADDRYDKYMEQSGGSK